MRIAGFASTVLGVRNPVALAIQYVAVLAAFGLSIRAISRGTIVEPPAAIMEPITRLIDRTVQRVVDRFPIFRDDDRDARI